MEVAEQAAIPAPKIFGITQTPGVRLFMLAGGAAAILALMVGIWLWNQQPEYRVLFSNYTDRDGGAIVASLQQMNIPYKFSEGGSAILVPATQVHDARLKLASQGLPKGGNVGFELMENQKLGISQFLEQVNFQRALEGELARSIESISTVQSARVHLALPKDTVFVRDQQKPTASVVLNLYANRLLDQQQVSAIIHLVASSVPELPAQNVTIVDQSGNLLSDTTKPNTSGQLNPSQLKYVQDIQQDIVKRIESIISPIVGAANIRAEATADIDFSRTEQAAETYRPNQSPETASVRSQQTSESVNKTGANASGVPGAMSNQPPTSATAPITVPGGASATAASATAANNGITQKEATTNYEVDKTVRYTQLAMGGVKRLTVAVVVNFKRETDKNGKVSSRELTDAEKAQITDLAKEAMGFNQERGDSLNVVNSQFVNTEKEIVEGPFWKQAEYIELGKNALKYLLTGAVILYLFFGYLKPILWKIMGKDIKEEQEKELEKEKERIKQQELEESKEELNEDGSVVSLSGAEPPEVIKARASQVYEKNLGAAQELAKSDPKIVANVIKNWVNGE